MNLTGRIHNLSTIDPKNLLIKLYVYLFDNILIRKKFYFIYILIRNLIKIYYKNLIMLKSILRFSQKILLQLLLLFLYPKVAN